MKPEGKLGAGTGKVAADALVAAMVARIQPIAKNLLI
jgi:hypothetical protein